MDIENDDTPFDAVFEHMPRPRLDAVVDSYAAPTLGQLLTQYNEMLGWRQADLAKALGKDTAEVSRIVTGKHRRPQDATLQLIADAYRRAGLVAVTLELLKAARDNQDRVESNPWQLPNHWLRLIQSIMALDQRTQDALYRIVSTQVREIGLVLAQRIDE